MTQPKTPAYQIFHVVGEGEKASWTQIGAAWHHNDNEGLNIVRNYQPLVEGREVFRKYTPKKKEDK